jgi:hypothetical protein
MVVVVSINSNLGSQQARDHRKSAEAISVIYSYMKAQKNGVEECGAVFRCDGYEGRILKSGVAVTNTKQTNTQLLCTKQKKLQKNISAR